MADYPLGRFRYKVEIEGIEVAGFSEVTGVDASVDVIEYREGDMVQTPMKFPGLMKYGNITLKKGLISGDKTIYDWMMAGLTGSTEMTRKTVTISMLGPDGTPKASWRAINAWPVKYTGPDFNATASEVAVETLEIAHEGLTRES